ncbi:MAG: Transcriptional regulator, AraC family [Labilithrix sp.]|nr:Transcriptional regulator, AraC family [Labilithrix sp.]
MAFVRAILLAYEKYGVDPAGALRAARITPAQVRREAARIDASQLETFSATAMQELDDEALGWFERKLPWGTYGMLCRASLGAPTLGVALKRWCRHHRLLTTAVDLRLEVDRGEARLVVRELRDFGAMREFCLLTCLRFVHGYACWLVNSQLPLREVTFPIAAPPHAAVFPLLFPGPVRWDAERTSMAFDARYLELTPKRDERALTVMLQRALLLTVKQYRRDRLLVNRVREHLQASTDPGTTAREVAAAVHVSVRSLHRQLANEGASLQGIKDDVHRARALDLLRRTSLSIKQVATRVGFSNEKSFSRAFKVWTGETPSEHRRSATS